MCVEYVGFVVVGGGGGVFVCVAVFLIFAQS